VSSGAAPKLVTPDYYEQGIAYQSVIDARARAAALGWRVKLDDARSSAGRVLVTLTERSGAPLTRLRGQAELYRVDNPALDQAAPLEPVAGEPGVYAVRIARPARGLWSIRLALAPPESPANSPYSLSLPPIRFVSP
jgi:nitrogen fixation protein FixH